MIRGQALGDKKSLARVGQAGELLMSPFIKDPQAEKQDCIVCLANARAGMEAISEVELFLKSVNLRQADRMLINEKLKLAWYTIHLRKSMCHGLHGMELPRTNKSPNSA